MVNYYWSEKPEKLFILRIEPMLACIVVEFLLERVFPTLHCKLVDNDLAALRIGSNLAN